MDIVENLVHSTYVLEAAAKEIKKDTPPRTLKKKANKAMVIGFPFLDYNLIG